MKNKDLYGLILAGGKSSRMGYDKRTIRIHTLDQQDYLNNLLACYCEKVFVSCKNKDQVSSHLNVLVDRFDLQSPLNGILTALATEKKTSWLIVAVDMPFVDKRSVDMLIQNRNKACLATCFRDSDNHLPDPMFGIWEPAALHPLMKYYEGGHISPREFLRTGHVHVIDSMEKQFLMNLNTPDDVRRISSDHSSPQ